MARSERPSPPRRLRGKWLALVLAIAVNLFFIGVLVFSVTWQNRKPEPVTAELYAPPTKAPTITPKPVPPPVPIPRPEPKPVPPPEPKPEPKPAEPKVQQPDPRAADIALKAKQEAERKQREEAERKEAEAKKQEEKRQAEARDRQQREIAAMRAQAEREVQLRTQAERESQMRAQAEREAQTRAQQNEQKASSRAQSDWENRIRAKIHGNVVVPPDMPGNPEAVFEVVQLPTGEIIDVQLRKSSGIRAYDDAVQRAIIKSSPLPRPDRAELFQRALTLRFRPLD